MEVKFVPGEQLLEHPAGFSGNVIERAILEQSTFKNGAVFDGQRTGTFRRYRNPDIRTPAKK